ncbi:unnamed protein product [Amoebophrya sp. A120]|nr:unnamed protein product [Amoebophrya sp. A120]|eukprot:GSA120T00017748001.1
MGAFDGTTTGLQGEPDAAPEGRAATAFGASAQDHAENTKDLAAEELPAGSTSSPDQARSEDNDLQASPACSEESCSVGATTGEQNKLAVQGEDVLLQQESEDLGDELHEERSDGAAAPPENYHAEQEERLQGGNQDEENCNNLATETSLSTEQNENVKEHKEEDKKDHRVEVLATTHQSLPRGREQSEDIPHIFGEEELTSESKPPAQEGQVWPKKPMNSRVVLVGGTGTTAEAAEVSTARGPGPRVELQQSCSSAAANANIPSASPTVVPPSVVDGQFSLGQLPRGHVLEELDLAGKNVDADVMQHLCDLLIQHRISIRCLRLDHNKLCDVALVYLAKIILLQTHPFREIVLSDNQVTPLGVFSLLFAFGYLSHLYPQLDRDEQSGREVFTPCVLRLERNRIAASMVSKFSSLLQTTHIKFSFVKEQHSNRSSCAAVALVNFDQQILQHTDTNLTVMLRIARDQIQKLYGNLRSKMVQNRQNVPTAASIPQSFHPVNVPGISNLSMPTASNGGEDNHNGATGGASVDNAVNNNVNCNARGGMGPPGTVAPMNTSNAQQGNPGTLQHGPPPQHTFPQHMSMPTGNMGTTYNQYNNTTSPNMMYPPGGQQPIGTMNGPMPTGFYPAPQGAQHQHPHNYGAPAPPGGPGAPHMMAHGQAAGAHGGPAGAYNSHGTSQPIYTAQPHHPQSCNYFQQQQAMATAQMQSQQHAAYMNAYNATCYNYANGGGLPYGMQQPNNAAGVYPGGAAGGLQHQGPGVGVHPHTAPSHMNAAGGGGYPHSCTPQGNVAVSPSGRIIPAAASVQPAGAASSSADGMNQDRTSDLPLEEPSSSTLNNSVQNKSSSNSLLRQARTPVAARAGSPCQLTSSSPEIIQKLSLSCPLEQRRRSEMLLSPDTDDSGEKSSDGFYAREDGGARSASLRLNTTAPPGTLSAAAVMQATEGRSRKNQNSSSQHFCSEEAGNAEVDRVVDTNVETENIYSLKVAHQVEQDPLSTSHSSSLAGASTAASGVGSNVVVATTGPDQHQPPKDVRHSRTAMLKVKMAFTAVEKANGGRGCNSSSQENKEGATRSGELQEEVLLSVHDGQNKNNLELHKNQQFGRGIMKNNLPFLPRTMPCELLKVRVFLGLLYDVEKTQELVLGQPLSLIHQPLSLIQAAMLLMVALKHRTWCWVRLPTCVKEVDNWCAAASSSSPAGGAGKSGCNDSTTTQHQHHQLPAAEDGESSILSASNTAEDDNTSIGEAPAAAAAATMATLPKHLALEAVIYELTGMCSLNLNSLKFYNNNEDFDFQDDFRDQRMYRISLFEGWKLLSHSPAYRQPEMQAIVNQMNFIKELFENEKILSKHKLEPWLYAYACERLGVRNLEEDNLQDHSIFHCPGTGMMNQCTTTGGQQQQAARPSILTASTSLTASSSGTSKLDRVNMNQQQDSHSAVNTGSTASTTAPFGTSNTAGLAAGVPLPPYPQDHADSAGPQRWMTSCGRGQTEISPYPQDADSAGPQRWMTSCGRGQRHPKLNLNLPPPPPRVGGGPTMNTTSSASSTSCSAQQQGQLHLQNQHSNSSAPTPSNASERGGGPTPSYNPNRQSSMVNQQQQQQQPMELCGGQQLSTQTAPSSSAGGNGTTMMSTTSTSLRAGGLNINNASSCNLGPQQGQPQHPIGINSMQHQKQFMQQMAHEHQQHQQFMHRQHTMQHAMQHQMGSCTSSSSWAGPTGVPSCYNNGPMPMSIDNSQYHPVVPGGPDDKQGTMMSQMPLMAAGPTMGGGPIVPGATGMHFLPAGVQQPPGASNAAMPWMTMTMPSASNPGLYGSGCAVPGGVNKGSSSQAASREDAAGSSSGPPELQQPVVYQ